MSALLGSPGQVIGRYVLFDEIASGGMATVHLGRASGAGGFSRLVAIKRLHPHIAKDPELRGTLLDEARIVSRIHHPNVVSTIDVVTAGDELLLVMEYVHGEPLHKLARDSTRARRRVPVRIALAVVAQALYGLHAAHEARDDRGFLLDVVHRDVSPQNILVGADGAARVLDFGVAKAAGRMQSTRDGALKGKLSYMPPEQIRGGHVDRRTDVYAAAVVLWELLVGRPLYTGPNDGVTMLRALEANAPPPGDEAPGLPAGLDAIVMRGLAKEPADRFPTALEMADALHELGGATAGEIAGFVREHAGQTLDERLVRVRSIERRTLPIEGPGAPAEGESGAGKAALADPAEGSVARSATVRRERRARAPLWLAAFGFALLGFAVGIGWLVGRSDRSEDALNTIPVTSAAEPPSAGTAPGSAAPTATLAAGETPSATAALAAGETPSATAGPTSAATPGVTATLAGTATPSASARPGAGSGKRPGGAKCNPPYTVDADGIRTPKPECL